MSGTINRREASAITEIKAFGAELDRLGQQISALRWRLDDLVLDLEGAELSSIVTSLPAIQSAGGGMDGTRAAEGNDDIGEAAVAAREAGASSFSLKRDADMETAGDFPSSGAGSAEQLHTIDSVDMFDVDAASPVVTSPVVSMLLEQVADKACDEPVATSAEPWTEQPISLPNCAADDLDASNELAGPAAADGDIVIGDGSAPGATIEAICDAATDLIDSEASAEAVGGSDDIPVDAAEQPETGHETICPAHDMLDTEPNATTLDLTYAASAGQRDVAVATIPNIAIDDECTCSEIAIESAAANIDDTDTDTDSSDADTTTDTTTTGADTGAEASSGEVQSMMADAVLDDTPVIVLADQSAQSPRADVATPVPAAVSGDNVVAMAGVAKAVAGRTGTRRIGYAFAVLASGTVATLACVAMIAPDMVMRQLTALMG